MNGYADSAILDELQLTGGPLRQAKHGTRDVQAERQVGPRCGLADCIDFFNASPRLHLPAAVP